MTDWKSRSLESRALFNPAFCGLLLFHGAKSYERNSEPGLPFSLSPIVLAFALNAKLRGLLPRTTRTKFAVWVRTTPEVRIQLAQRVAAVVPLTRESLLFLMQHGAVAVSDARIRSVGRRVRGLSEYLRTSNLDELMEGARIIGALLSQVDSDTTAFMTLGLTV
jgi:hypothetical protein